MFNNFLKLNRAPDKHPSWRSVLIALFLITKQIPATAAVTTTSADHAIFDASSKDLNSLPKTGPSSPLIFVYLQGYNSCGRIEERPVRHFLDAAQQNPHSKMYWGCFDGGHLNHLEDTKEHFYLYSMNSKGQWSHGEEIDPQSGSLQIALYLQKDLKSIASAYPKADQQNNKTDIFVAGHSHGGWMAMRTAYQVSLIHRAKLQQLLTIDPISYTLCASHWFPVNVLYNTFNWFGEPDDCHRAPRDLEHIIPTIVETANGQWVHIYEDTMPYLTSGPIEQANLNIRYEPPTNLDWVTAHRAIMHTDWTWSFFENRLAEIRGMPTKPVQSKPQFNSVKRD